MLNEWMWANPMLSLAGFSVVIVCSLSVRIKQHTTFHNMVVTMGDSTQRLAHAAACEIGGHAVKGLGMAVNIL